MKNKILSLMTVFSLWLLASCNGSVNQQSSVQVSSNARDAISALKELDSRLETGISYAAYQKLVGDTGIQVKAYHETYSENDVDLYTEVSLALEDYKEALGVWDFIFKENLFDNSLGSNNTTKLLFESGSSDTSKGKYFMAHIATMVNNPPSTASMEATHYGEDSNGKFKYIDLKELQQLDWKDAKEHLVEIDKLTK